MWKAGVYALAVLGLFALVFALLPSATPPGAQTGATLKGVELSLYPARDTDAVWRFRAADVTSDPLQGKTHLAGLSEGGRWVTRRGPDGQPQGRVLDATLSAPDLTIDAQDNMLTRQASITLVQQCAAIDLKGTSEQPVRVEQGYGFSAPVAQLDSPALKGRVTRMRMTFGFVVEDAGQDSTFGWDPDAKETCQNGKRVPLTFTPTTGEPT